MTLSPLFTDLYQLTMLYAYFKSGKTQTTSFELFIRELPEKRNYLVFAGLKDAVNFIENLSFSKEDIDYLYSLNLFPDDFLDFLKSFRFTGNLWALKEGEIFFQYEPVLRVEAPIYEAQLLETALMNQIHIATLLASKGARIYSVSKGKSLADFSLRRTHGSDAGMKAAYSSYLTGFSGTSNVLAGKELKLPVIGTVAHSFVMAFEDEKEAFKAYLKAFPQRGVLLIDTYDTLRGLKNAIEASRETGIPLKGVRLDSGDVVELSKKVREILDKEGFKECRIIVSGGLDEYEIDRILKAGAPVDAFGVGTKFGTSSDSPYIDFVYKLVEFNGRPVMKTSSGKAMFPGRKQVYRQGGKDLITLWNEKAEGEPLLEKVMEKGKLLKELPSLSESREYFLARFNSLPEELKDIYSKREYPVYFSKELLNLKGKLEEEIGEKKC
ncbi:nicotinate phosphoribosyltransferase [Thermovibrio sp.]